MYDIPSPATRYSPTIIMITIIVVIVIIMNGVRVFFVSFRFQFSERISVRTGAPLHAVSTSVGHYTV